MKRGTSKGVPREATVVTAAVVTVLFAVGWIWSIGRVFAMWTTSPASTPLPTRIASALPSSRAPRAAYLMHHSRITGLARAADSLRAQIGEFVAIAHRRAADAHRQAAIRADMRALWLRLARGPSD